MPRTSTFATGFYELNEGHHSGMEPLSLGSGFGRSKMRFESFFPETSTALKTSKPSDVLMPGSAAPRLQPAAFGSFLEVPEGRTHLHIGKVHSSFDSFPPGPKPTGPDQMEDKSQECAAWVEKGECEKNPQYMSANCKYSCQCQDTDKQNCRGWMDEGRCQWDKNMSRLCKRTCNYCTQVLR
eukprot:TRINITY_DN5222_c2_g1_i2.p1 TRINITY_DN5222_c2_g1~~TRINITY_DN5222_c2_g1_i2.p1  ORF type:complete len:182 (+),score=32.87 TRINITY_DN5222_c2_g1_i2:77-622(+)